MRSAQHRNQLKYFYMYVSPFVIFRCSKYVRIKKLKLERKIGQKTRKLIVETETKFCSVTLVFVRINDGNEKETIYFELSSLYF